MLKNAKYRVSIHRHQSDGFRDNAFLNRKNTNQREETSLRGKLIWNVADDWLFDLTTMFVDINDGYDAFSINNSMTMLSDKPGKDVQRSSGASMKVIYTAFDSYTIESVSTLAHSKIDFSFVNPN